MGRLALEKGQIRSRPEVECFATDDPWYVAKYQAVRKRVYEYERIHGSDHLPREASHKQFDDCSDIVVIVVGGIVVGGVRLTIAENSSTSRLPMEKQTFALHRSFAHIAAARHCEISRLAILPEYRDSVHTSLVLSKALEIAFSKRVRYVVARSTLTRGRFHRRAFRRLGFDIEMHSDVFTHANDRSKLLLVLDRFKGAFKPVSID